MKVSNDMNENLIINADDCYKQAEEKANHYFQSLYTQVQQRTYAKILTEDIHLWKHNHIRNPSILSLFSRGKGKANPLVWDHPKTKAAIR